MDSVKYIKINLKELKKIYCLNHPVMKSIYGKHFNKLLILVHLMGKREKKKESEKITSSADKKKSLNIRW